LPEIALFTLIALRDAVLELNEPRMLMKKIIASFFLTIALITPAVADKPDVNLFVYAVVTVPEYIDMLPVGPSVGDMYTSNGELTFSPDGPRIGGFYTHSTVVVMDEANNRSAHVFNAELILPDGSVYLTDVVEGKVGQSIAPGHTYQGAIIGGTKKYAGIRGSFESELQESGKLEKITLSFWLGK
jgi:hypothetical protein